MKTFTHRETSSGTLIPAGMQIVELRDIEDGKLHALSYSSSFDGVQYSDIERALCKLIDVDYDTKKKELGRSFGFSSLLTAGPDSVLRRFAYRKDSTRWFIRTEVKYQLVAYSAFKAIPYFPVFTQQEINDIKAGVFDWVIEVVAYQMAPGTNTITMKSIAETAIAGKSAVKSKFIPTAITKPVTPQSVVKSPADYLSDLEWLANERVRIAAEKEENKKKFDQSCKDLIACNSAMEKMKKSLNILLDQKY